MSNSTTKVVISDKVITEDKLRVNLGKGKIKFTGSVFKYRDADTRQIVFFIPSLDLSSYGSTTPKAKEMLDFVMNEYFQWLGHLPHKQIEAELIALGWKHVKLKNKEYSKAYVDGDGMLQNLNAVGDKVEQLTVVA